jgi:hypothetical protein
MARRASRAGAMASEPKVVEVATALLARGNAVDAVAAAVFTAAALDPSVLLGPLQMLIGGAGAGLLAVDGRVRQPGLGLPRPRGFLAGEGAPPAARVAVPALPSAIAAALATFGGVSLARIMAPALDLARREPKGRQAVLRRVMQRGPAAFTDPEFAGELIASAGRVAGGLISERDLAELRPAVTSCKAAPLGDFSAVTVPWGALAVRDAAKPSMDGRSARVIACTDRRGLTVVACYEVSAVGLDIPELGLRAPPHAEPVRRGEVRVRAGTPRPSSAPIALVVDSKGTPSLGAGFEQERDAEKMLGHWLAAPSAQDHDHLIVVGSLGRT